jgi:hypothetical protein
MCRDAEFELLRGPLAAQATGGPFLESKPGSLFESVKAIDTELGASGELTWITDSKRGTTTVLSLTC